MRVLRSLLMGAVPVSIAVIAYLNASAVSALVGTSIGESIALPAPSEPKATFDSDLVAKARLEAKSARAILDRNPFDHLTGPLRPPPQAGPEAEAQRDLDPRTAPICEGVRPLEVVGDEDQSVAFASLEVGGKRILRKRGGEVGDRQVAYVGRDRVWLEGSRGLCQALLFGEPPPKPDQGGGTDGGVAATGNRSALEIEVEKKIQKTGPNEYAIDRSAVDRILEAQQEIMKSRITPEKENGRTVGMRIAGIKPGSIVNMLGIENNDRLETINGFDISDPEKMLEAYARIRTGADKMTIHLTRGGKPINVDYTIR